MKRVAPLLGVAFLGSCASPQQSTSLKIALTIDDLPLHAPYPPGDTPDSVSARVHALEHIIYPHVCSLIAAGRIEWRRGTVHFDGVPLAAPLIEENYAAA